MGVSEQHKVDAPIDFIGRPLCEVAASGPIDLPWRDQTQQPPSQNFARPSITIFGVCSIVADTVPYPVP